MWQTNVSKFHFRHTEMNCVVVNICVGCRRAHSQRFCISTRKWENIFIYLLFLLDERRHSKYFQEFPLSNVTLVSQANRLYSQSSSQLSRPLDSLLWQVSLQGPSNTLVMDKVSKKPHLHFTIKTLHKNLNPSLYCSLLHIKNKINSELQEQRGATNRHPLCITA